MSLLELTAIGRRFGGVRALDDVSFEVSQGEIVGLIGPNGAGKSTLFSIIAGALTPSTGRVIYRDQDVTGWKAHQAAAAGIARTFQLMQIFESMSVLDNCVVAAHLRHRGRRAAHAHASQVLEYAGLQELAHVRAATLTAPSRKRLEIARALTTEPQLLLLDEVLSGLTPTEGQQAVALLKKINRAGTTILMVEHVMEIIMPLCDRLVVLDHGQLISQGTPAEVSRDPVVLDAYLGSTRC